MPRRAVPLMAGEHYHIFNSGHNRQAIFFERENYVFFLRRLRQYLAAAQTSEVSETSEVWAAPATIVAYCLMPNHFHLLIQPHTDDLSNRMRRLCISYAKAVNKRYSRVGALFQGQFRAVRVDKDEYLLHLSRYIHLNPVMAGLAKGPEDWEFSSYRDCVNLRPGTLPNPNIVLAQFAAPQAYREFVADYIPDSRKAIAHLLLGDDD